MLSDAVTAAGALPTEYMVVNTDGVFQTYSDNSGDLNGLFIRLKNLTTSEIHTPWDVAFLETYIKLNMVPWSLRWQVSPQKGDLELEK